MSSTRGYSNNGLRGSPTTSDLSSNGEDNFSFENYLRMNMLQQQEDATRREADRERDNLQRRHELEMEKNRQQGMQ